MPRRSFRPTSHAGTARWVSTSRTASWCSRSRSPVTTPRSRPPAIRVHGELRPLAEFGELTPSQIREMLYAIITQKQREKFENELELDTSYTLPGKSRFRLNMFLQRDAVGAVMRAIPYEIVPF